MGRNNTWVARSLQRVCRAYVWSGGGLILTKKEGNRAGKRKQNKTDMQTWLLKNSTDDCECFSSRFIVYLGYRVPRNAFRMMFATSNVRHYLPLIRHRSPRKGSIKTAVPSSGTCMGLILNWRGWASGLLGVVLSLAVSNVG